ncbi:MAG: alanine racemase [Candidatus Krumholzibacteriota bacterium]|nr:alanine racemase [Candidatus Krumholzibacteriota bacterium]
MILVMRMVMKMDRFPAWVEVDLDAFKLNISQIREHLDHRADILLVVKADAYGHGAVRISRLAVECGVKMLGVATLDEGRELREACIDLPIIILSPVLPQELREVLENDLAVTTSSVAFAQAASDTAGSMGKICTMHIEINTGMGRAGLSQDSAVESILQMKKMENLDIEGIFTHFPASDSDYDYTSDQIEMFTDIVSRLKAHSVTFRYIHCANSAAIINFPESQFNMVRPGIMAYGHHPSIDLKDRIEVIPVMSFKSRLILVREVKAGESISYGRTYIAPHPMTVGVIAAGYGHGMSHRLSNRGMVLFRGEKVPIVGRVTMDMTMVDLTGFESPVVGEEIVIFGRQREGSISADDIAQWDGTLNYEVLCRISKRVVRVYFRSGRVESTKSLLGVHELL